MATHTSNTLPHSHLIIGYYRYTDNNRFNGAQRQMEYEAMQCDLTGDLMKI